MPPASRSRRPDEPLERRATAVAAIARVGSARVVAELSGPLSAAHELRPGFLELRERGPGRYALPVEEAGGWRNRDRDRAGDSRRLYASRSPRARQLTPGAVVVRGELSLRRRARRQDARRSRGSRPPSPTCSCASQHADGRMESHLVKPVAPSFTLGAVDIDGVAALVPLLSARRRAHPARRRPSAVRARAAAARERRAGCW